MDSQAALTCCSSWKEFRGLGAAFIKQSQSLDSSVSTDCFGDLDHFLLTDFFSFLFFFYPQRKMCVLTFLLVAGSLLIKMERFGLC